MPSSYLCEVKMRAITDLNTITPKTDAADHGRRFLIIRFWLYAVVVLIMAMVVVGGATRLTDSGLSITEWKPLLGAIPPLSTEDWQEAFDKYRLIPEYQLVNKGMSLSEFQFIFWWEWAHRFLGRIIGVVFFVPAVLFWALGWLPSRLKAQIAGLFILGGLQGVVGWWMVASGLVERVDVSQYRLAVHLTLACFLFAAVLWVALGLRAQATVFSRPSMRQATIGLVILVFIQIFAGGLVAGMDAGLAYNTWPAMDGALVPSSLMVLSPQWLNFFENAKTVQFDHRMIAYGLWAFALLHALLVSRASVAGILKTQAWLLFAAVTAQALLGILTLLWAVPLDVALSHQFGALIVLGVAIWYWRTLEGPSDVFQTRAV